LKIVGSNFETMNAVTEKHCIHSDIFSDTIICRNLIIANIRASIQ